MYIEGLKYKGHLIRYFELSYWTHYNRLNNEKFHPVLDISLSEKSSLYRVEDYRNLRWGTSWIKMQDFLQFVIEHQKEIYNMGVYVEEGIGMTNFSICQPTPFEKELRKYMKFTPCRINGQHEFDTAWDVHDFGLYGKNESNDRICMVDYIKEKGLRDFYIIRMFKKGRVRIDITNKDAVAKLFAKEKFINVH